MRRAVRGRGFFGAGHFRGSFSVMRNSSIAANSRLTCRASQIRRHCPHLLRTLHSYFRVFLMLIVMRAQATEEQIRTVCQKVESLGYRAHPMPGAQRTAIGITGNKGEVESGTLEEMPGVQEVIRVSKPYKLVSRDVKPDNTVITFPGSAVTIGGVDLVIMAGPCGIESREQALATAERVARAGAQFFRGGAYKPRTSAYSFHGLD